MRHLLALSAVALLVWPAGVLARQGTPAQPASAAAQAPVQAPVPGTRRREKAPLDPDLLMHLGITAGRIRADGCVDATEKVKGRVVGNLMRNTIGPGEGFVFNGSTDWIVLNESPSDAMAGVPTRAFTVSTWVVVAKADRSASFVSRTGAGGGGWSLGHEGDAFAFSLSAGGKPATVVRSPTKLKAGKWYNVVGVYDGRTMRMFVNGEPAGESMDQSGEIAYPPDAAYSVGARRPGEAATALAGTLLEVRVLGRAVPQQQVVEEYIPGTPLASYEPQLEATQRFVVKPYLQSGTPDGMTVMWEASRPATGIVEYGDKLPYTQRTESSADGLIHKARITGLKPHANYFYRVRMVNPDGTEMLSEDLTFQTNVPAGVPLAFAVIGDTQRNKPVIEKLQKFAFTLRPNLQIHVGDVVDKASDKNEWNNEMFEGSYPLMSRVVMYPAIGNHEENHSYYYRYFDLPSPAYYYTYTAGDAQFYSIDTNKPVTKGSPQYEWLDRELGKSTAKWKFVYHHHPAYSSDEDDYGDTYKGQSTLGDSRMRDIPALLEKHKVDIDFNGHIHSYERSWPITQGKIDLKNGVRYVTAGGGGGGLESAGPSRTWFAQRVYRGHHICMVTLFDNTLQMQTFDLEGRLIDQMDIVK